MTIVPISILKPLELVFPYHLKNLSKMIMKSGIVETPIIADKKHGIVLDGSHRYIFFLKNGFKTVPVHFVDYEDENIRVGSRLIHRYLIEGDINISKEEVVRRGLTGDLFTPRTTRHFFPFRKNERMDVPLEDLESGEPVDVSKYIANTDIQDEINHNKKYLKEIENEFDELIRYMEEVRQTKQYLKKQIELMENNNRKTAFFPGKFQPVHLGHIITLMNIYDKYDKIIVGITEDTPEVISQEERKDIFDRVFKYLPKFEVETIKGTIVNSTSPENLPDFDVCLSGNEAVIKKLHEFGLHAEFIDRSRGVGYSGKEIRTLLGKTPGE